MSKHMSRISLVALVLFSLAFFGWSDRTNAQQSTAEQRMNRAADQTGQAIDRTADRAGQAADRAGQQARGAMDRATGQAGTMTGQAGSLPPGVTPKEARGASSIRDVVSTVTRDALTKGKFNDVIDHFAQEDRSRLSNETKGMNYDDLNSAIDRFETQWQSKYNQKFSISNEDQVLGSQYLSVSQGEITDPSQLSSNWPVSPTSGRSAMSAGSERNLDKGRDIAVCTLTGISGQPDLNLSLVHEALNAWKFDIPNSVNASTIKQNLVQAISDLSSQSSQWPTDVNEAQRVVAHHICAALYGVSPSQSGQSSGSMGSSSSSSQQSPSGRSNY